MILGERERAVFTQVFLIIIIFFQICCLHYFEAFYHVVGQLLHSSLPVSNFNVSVDAGPVRTDQVEAGCHKRGSGVHAYAF